VITCYAFRAVPPFAQGLVRDLRVRWALEEVGLPYRTTLVGDGTMPRCPGGLPGRGAPRPTRLTSVLSAPYWGDGDELERGRQGGGWRRVRYLGVVAIHRLIRTTGGPLCFITYERGA
jgi:hypothetical protein